MTTVDFLARRSIATGFEPVVLSGPQTKSKLVVIIRTDITLINYNDVYKNRHYTVTRQIRDNTRIEVILTLYRSSTVLSLTIPLS